jgi:hypothetical protein
MERQVRSGQQLDLRAGATSPYPKLSFLVESSARTGREVKGMEGRIEAVKGELDELYEKLKIAAANGPTDKSRKIYAKMEERRVVLKRLLAEAGRW